MTTKPPATNVRYAVVMVTTLAAFFLYLDRACMAEIVNSNSFQREFALGEQQTGNVLSIFFTAYALAQIPAGWLSDRFGARGLMTFYIAAWSLCTALTGFAWNLTTLLLTRVGCGLAEAGAYPTSGSLLSRWAPFKQRGMASSMVTFGGRAGAAVASSLTVLFVGAWHSWRPAGWIYGAAGVVVAALFWRVFRETPAEHPKCNDSERELIAEGRPANAGQTSKRLPVMALLTSRSLWLMCVYQFGSNFGWVFLITWMPKYLKDVMHVDEGARGFMSMIVLFAGITGLFIGGWLTDYCTQRLGLRWGRAVPLMATRLVAAGGYLACLWIDSPWVLVAALFLVSCAADSSVAASWAYWQDIGGKYVGSILGWSNMWGNLGASASAAVLPWILKKYDHNGDWHSVFIALAASFIVCSIVALGIDASEPLGRAEETKEGVGNG